MDTKDPRYIILFLVLFVLILLTIVYIVQKIRRRYLWFWKSSFRASTVPEKKVPKDSILLNGANAQQKPVPIATDNEHPREQQASEKKRKPSQHIAIQVG
jgi:hypothetical protein